MKTSESLRVQNQNFVDAFLRRKGPITFTELFIFILIGLSLCLTSCSPVLYTTVGQNVALFHQKGEVALSISQAETKYAAGVGAQVAAAVDSSILIMSSYYSLNNIGGSGGGSYFEFGVGKFRYSTLTKFCAELILGTGLGSIKNVDNTNNTFANVSYFKPFIQPSFGFTTKIIDIALTPRIGYVTYTSTSDNVTDPQMRTDLDAYYSTKKNTLVLEPGVTIRVGYKNIKFQAQYNHTSFNYSSANNFDPVDKDFVSLGLHILVSNRWLKPRKY